MVSADVYALSLLAAFIWGANQIFSKRGMAAGGDIRQGSLMVAGMSGLVYWIVLGVESTQLSRLFQLSITDLGVFVLAGVIWGLGWISAYAGVDRVGASVNSAAINTRPLFATVLAIALLGEAVTPLMGIGVVLLVVGLVILSISGGGEIGGWRPIYLLFPLATAGSWAVANVLRRFGLSMTPVTVLQGLALNSTAAVVLLVVYLVLAGKVDVVLAAPRRSYVFFTATGLGTSLALFALFEALDRGPVAVVDPLTGVAPLFTAVLAYAFLSDLERVTKGLVAGAILIVLGAGLVTTM